MSSNTKNRLSVQVLLSGLSFLITVTETNEVLFFSEKRFDSDLSPAELLSEIIALLSETESQHIRIDEVSVIYANNLYSIVPSSLFDAKKASEYLKFNSKILSNDFVTHDTLDNYGITPVYVPFVNINNYLFERYGSFKYYHATSILLNAILTLEKESELPKVYINVLDSHFDLVVVKKASLLFCNTYYYKTPEDFIYYVLFSLEQLKLNPDTIEIVLCGAIVKSDTNYEILYNYIRNVSFFSMIHPQINFTETDLPHHNFILKNAL